ncbi:MAG: FG-GAP repeat protein [Bacteroidales bacterium]|nr:FG-GAP repeat protein [Bacteroidales bacterium]
MRKFSAIFSAVLALVLCSAAQAGNTTTATVNWKIVDANNPDAASGYIPTGSTAQVGYNKISGNTVAFGNTAWGVNRIGYARVEVPALSGDIIRATLSMQVSGSTDSRRTTTWGVGYNGTTVSTSTSYNNADRSITTTGNTYTTATRSSSVFETATFDITPALAGSASYGKAANLIIYELAAAGGYMKNPVVTIEYTAPVSHTSTGVLRLTTIDGSNPNSAAGFLPLDQPTHIGFNKLSNGSVALGNSAWGVNKIGYMSVDVSSLNGNITRATLTMNVSGSSDSKRTTTWGVGFNNTAVSNNMTFNSADKSITTLGNTYTTTTRSSRTYETATFDITNALRGNTDGKVANLIVYETAAAGGYMMNPVVTVEYTTTTLGNNFAKQNRGLWACKAVNGQDVFVSWRMRDTDNPFTTTYKLYADGNLVATLTDKTNVTLPSNYANALFSLDVFDGNGALIDCQSDVRCDNAFFHHIQLSYPGDYTMPNGSVVNYHPNDCSAYDMDGDGEQEIIVRWDPSNTGATASATGPAILDCYKLDGTRLWRINFGPNVLAGCRFTFLCYDFDGDGRGEVIAKTAQGSKDATGAFLHKGPAANANHYASSVNSAGVITDGGQEWITCFDGATGRELATINYWPLFSAHSNWDDRRGYTDGNTYGHRGNWFKGCVATLNVNGKPTPCAVTLRGIYTYSYAAAYTWTGSSLNVVWKHSSTTPGQGIYGQGAHSVSVADVDNDGFDEILVGAAMLDHNGTVLWRSGLGHGDATHIGDFDPSNPGLEVFIITEETSAAYDAAMFDARTGRVLMYRAQTGGDTARGMALDCDETYDGSEVMEWGDGNLMTCKGVNIGPWHNGSTNSSSINYRIYWDGDLLDEYHDRSHIDKWNSSSKSWGRTMTLYSYGYGANSINSTKYNPNLQCDIYGDWREEAVYWATNGGNYYLTIFTTTTPSDYKLPWLRDDHTYDMAIAWQNCGYDQTPHLGYSPVEYYKSLGYNVNKALKAEGAVESPDEIIGNDDDNVQLFDLAGRPVANPTRGCFIRRSDAGSRIVIIK